jgi:hypothetical protein
MPDQPLQALLQQRTGQPTHHFAVDHRHRRQPAGPEAPGGEQTQTAVAGGFARFHSMSGA